MNIYEEILKTMSFVILIWEQNNNMYICKFSNKKDNLVQQGKKLDEYLENNPTVMPLYKNILETKEDQRLITKKQNIVVYYLHDIYYEVRTNIVDDISKYIQLSYINNQIRGPLTTMMGSISELYQLGLTSKQILHINQIEKSNFELISLTNDIVDIINLSQNIIKLNLEHCNLKNSVKEALEIVNYYSDSKKVNINLKIHKNIPNLLLFDQQRLKQILINILTISLKNTDEGCINIHVSLFNEMHGPYDYVKVDPPKYNILFKIQDSCNGISKSDIESIDRILDNKNNEFKNYYNYEFALIISKYLANLMCGNIWFENQPEFGVYYFFNIIA